ncbi:hypothetical protein K7432_012302 [Basidiobolus ranarum]|uniref:Chitin-binding type-1 domain-containing protein n=1 Tax=Basidiobolus ranarum TaxID=34480 RepID=A0ABR2VSG8_9FUNG
MKSTLVTVALIACMAPVYQASVSLDGTCGNGVECPTGSCCSTWGFCGTGSAYCSGNGGNGNTNSDGNGNGGGSSDTSNPNHDGQTSQNQPNPENSQPSPAPTQPGGDGNNSGSTPQQPIATTPVANNPAPAPSNSNHPNGGDSLFKPLTVLSGVAIVLAGYLSH